ncbi:antibiotic biosynthesis monooxygenase [Streptomyces sp. NPDC003444]
MDISTVPLPRMDRADAEVALFSRRHVGGRTRQKAAVKAAASYWRNLSLPPEFRSVNFFESVDGENVMTVAQWAGEEAFDDFFRTRPPFSLPGVETAADAGRLRPEHYRLYRSHVGKEKDDAVCVVVPTFDVDGPERQRRAVDVLLDGPLREPFPGLKAMHFHLSTDGTRVLNYAEWTDQEAHEEFLRSATSRKAFETLHTVAGVRGLAGKRYLLHERLESPAA